MCKESERVGKRVELMEMIIAQVVKVIKTFDLQFVQWKYVLEFKKVRTAKTDLIVKYSILSFVFLKIIFWWF